METLLTHAFEVMNIINVLKKGKLQLEERAAKNCYKFIISFLLYM